jgi:hypothetical protein
LKDNRVKNNLSKCLYRDIFSLALIGLVSCNAFSTPVTPTIVPTVTHLSQGLTLSFTTISESNSLPVYTIAAHVPALAGSNDTRVVQFNQQMEILVQQEVDGFKQNVSGAPNPPIAMGSSFNLKYSLISPMGDILSIKLDIDVYIDGAAHPGHYSRTFTYDLTSGHQVNLDQLFLPGSNFLQVLSDYCKTELASRNIAFDASGAGADPLMDNYRSWNISANGLVITFDEYQVAAYAAGPQIVTIPYASLAVIIDPQGPLASFIP